MRCAEKYAETCHNAEDTGGARSRGGRFANMAGFARTVGVGVADIMALGAKYPEQYRAMLAILEDEALNSDKSATLIASYLKTRLELGERADEERSTPNMTVVFEHDVISDGE